MREKQSVSILFSFLIICLVGFLRAESALLIIKATNNGQSPGRGFIVAYSWIVVFTGVGAWFIFYCFVIHLISIILDKTSSFKVLVSLLGLAYIPQVLSSLVVFFLIFDNAEYISHALSSGETIKSALSGVSIFWTRVMDNIAVFITYLLCFFVIKTHNNFKAVEAILIAFLPPIVFEMAKLVFLNTGIH